MDESAAAKDGRGDRVPTVDFDLLDSQGMRESNARWDNLRSKCPVAWTEANGGAWIASSYDTVTEAFRNWETFRSGRDVRTVPGPGGSGDYMAAAPIPIQFPLMVPQDLDPPNWYPYRRVLAELLSPRAAASLQPRIAHWVTKFLDDVIETGEYDLMDLTWGIPGAVVLEWLGIPDQERHRVNEAFHNIAAVVPGSPTAEGARDELDRVLDLLGQLVIERRAEPREDIISVLANAEVDGKLAPLDHAVGMLHLIVGGGVGTTTKLASAAFVHLHYNPDDKARLINEPKLIDGAIEEFLRVYPPEREQGRTIVEDVELGGCMLRKDDRLIISEVSACRDEAAFPDADTFVIDRFPNRHVAFGAGMHRCPGSHLARRMFKGMLTQVLERMPDYRIKEEALLEYSNWGHQGGWGSIPITFTPGPRRTDI